ncbi:MAG: SCP2 sterol-binding domain-containing protein [Steroidobacteraceae bacterium]
MLTQALENLLNRNLVDSPRARELCAELRGRSLRIELEGMPAGVRIESTGESLRLASATTQDAADAEIIGTPFNLLGLAGATPEALLQRGAVRMRGDAELAQRFRELLLLLRPDFEEELARLLGDAAAHRVGRLARSVLDLGRRAAGTGVRNAAEYFAHERGDVVSRGEAEGFLGGVDALREDVDRLAARLALLAAAADDGTGDAP